MVIDERARCAHVAWTENTVVAPVRRAFLAARLCPSEAVTDADGISRRAQNLRDHQMCPRAARVSCREISKTFRPSSTLFARESRAGYLALDSPLSARAARGWIRPSTERRIAAPRS